MTNDCLALGHNELSFLRASLSQDLLRYLEKSPMNLAAGKTLRKRLSAFFTPDLLSVLIYRIAHWLYANNWGGWSILVSRLNFLVHKVSIGPQSCIGPGLRLPHPCGVVFCGKAGSGLTLYSLSVCCPLSAHTEGSLEEAPKLGDRVTIGAHAAVLGPVRVGDDVKISFKVRLACDAPAGVLVVSRRRAPMTRSRPDEAAATGFAAAHSLLPARMGR